MIALIVLLGLLAVFGIKFTILLMIMAVILAKLIGD